MKMKRVTTELHIITFIQIVIMAFVAGFVSEVNKPTADALTVLFLLIFIAGLAIWMVVRYNQIHTKTSKKQRSKN